MDFMDFSRRLYTNTGGHPKGLACMHDVCQKMQYKPKNKRR